MPVALLAAAILGLTLGSTTATTPSGPCEALSAGMMDMSFDDFDQGPDGWRRLHDSLACSDHAAPAIAAFRHAHRAGLTENQTALLVWHEGQVRALMDQVPEAVTLFRSSEWSGEPEWGRLYREATIAFLARDKVALEGARAELAVLPSAPGVFEQPPNLDVVDGLIRCFDQPYAIAYACRNPEED